MALGIYMILFVGMSVITVVGLSLLYLMKSHGARQVIFYIMAVWGMFIAAISATGLPTNYTLERLITWAIGFLSVQVSWCISAPRKIRPAWRRASLSQSLWRAG